MKEMRSGNLNRSPTMRDPRKFTVVIEPDEEGYSVGTVPTLRGCHTQAKNLDVLMKRMREAVALCLESERGATPALELVGIQQISV
jgi:predicted RNase H-like HicB family nuclease